MRAWGRQSVPLVPPALALVILLAGLGCGSSPQTPANGAPPSGTGGTQSSGGRGGSPATSPNTGGNSNTNTNTGGSAGSASPAPTADAAETAPGTDAPPAIPDSAEEAPPSAPLGEFPLAAIKAAKAQAYVAANAHLEGPTYRDGEVFFAADGDGWGLMRIDADRKLYRYHPKLWAVGTYLLSGGRMLVGEHNMALVMVYADGKVAQMPADLDGQQIPFANDVTVDAEGNIYASDRRGGGIYRITPTGQVSRVIAGQDVPNGVEIDPASKYLYFVTGSALNRMALPAPGTTTFGKVERLAPAGQPDGMQFDAWGNLWVADWAAKHLVVYDHEGKTITTVDSGGAPINLTFGGKDNDTIFVVNDFKGVAKIGPIPGLRGFLHPGAPTYTIKKMLDLVPANQPVQ